MAYAYEVLRSPSMSRPRSKSRSRSPIKYRHSHRSRSLSPRTHNQVPAYPSLKDMHKYEKSSLEHTKNEKTSTSRKERDSSDKGRSRSRTDISSRHGKSTSEHIRHEKGSVRRERDFLDDDSTFSREDRKAVDSSKFKYHKSSSKHREDSSSRSTKDRHSLDEDSTYSREDRRAMDYSTSKYHKSSSRHREDSSSRKGNIDSPMLKSYTCSSPHKDPTNGEPKDLKNAELEGTEVVADKEAYINNDVEGLGELTGFEVDEKPDKYSNNPMELQEEGMIPCSLEQDTWKKNSSALDDEPSSDAENLGKDNRSIVENVSGKIKQQYDIEDSKCVKYDDFKTSPGSMEQDFYTEDCLISHSYEKSETGEDQNGPKWSFPGDRDIDKTGLSKDQDDIIYGLADMKEDEKVQWGDIGGRVSEQILVW
ncbi:PREDICTED: DNA topoisomerase 1-like [Nelumbo nucifera]|uniref:DNA topoisomerase 1-like n=1 Tax=Nelumbo nucifera TaxID=4432 RepID=A0A1U7Z7Y7_NELNU|nr:PREDICTED: DNA topoisomerase 1-like [Nelumbo nucifera]